MSNQLSLMARVYYKGYATPSHSFTVTNLDIVFVNNINW